MNSRRLPVIVQSGDAPLSGVSRGLPMRAFLLCMLMAMSFSGCVARKYVEVRNNWYEPAALVEKFKPTPKTSERTELTLRSNDLERLGAESDDAIAGLVNVYEQEPTLETAYALAELNHALGRKLAMINPEKSVEHHVSGLGYAYRYLFDDQFDGQRNPFDPQFRGICDLYNHSLEASLRTAQKYKLLKPGSSIVVNTCQGKTEFTCQTVGFDWDPGEFAEFKFVSDYRLVGLPNRHRTHGLGVPLIAIRKDGSETPDREQFYPRGLSFPVTAFLRWERDSDYANEDGEKITKCVLELHDPVARSEIVVEGKTTPLESDISTPLAYFLNNPTLQKLDYYGFFRPDKAEQISGLYMIQPYQLGKIPVLMVHGLLSSPMTWMEVLNDLRSRPEIRDRYQFWFYLYPTGGSFWESAADLREELAETRNIFDPHHEQSELDQMVVVGHSMGGLIARLTSLDSGDRFWGTISDTPLDEVSASPAVKRLLTRAYSFKPVPEVRRVVTIASPHQGSGEANPFYRNLLRGVVTLPERTTRVGRELLESEKRFFRAAGRAVPATSLDALAPTSPLIPVLAETPNSRRVAYHNIFAVQPRQYSDGYEGDGIVTIASARRDDFDSQISIEATHTTAHRHPLAILELRRILLEHLATVDSPNGIQLLQHQSELMGESMTLPAVSDRDEFEETP
ncbi:MAG: alpha/beta hydrolase [Rhodopirellula sp.]|nr:alpha/beta hydrolase [Rhodopirellula sp.]